MKYFKSYNNVVQITMLENHIFFFRYGVFGVDGIDCIFIFANGSMHTEYFVAGNNYYIERKLQKTC